MIEHNALFRIHLHVIVLYKDAYLVMGCFYGIITLYCGNGKLYQFLTFKALEILSLNFTCGSCEVTFKPC